MPWLKLLKWGLPAIALAICAYTAYSVIAGITTRLGERDTFAARVAVCEDQIKRLEADLAERTAQRDACRTAIAEAEAEGMRRQAKLRAAQQAIHGLELDLQRQAAALELEIARDRAEREKLPEADRCEAAALSAAAWYRRDVLHETR